MESCAELFEIFKKIGGEYVSVKSGVVTQLMDPRVVNDGKYKDGAATYARVVEGVIIDANFPDGLEFLGLVNGIL